MADGILSTVVGNILEVLGSQFLQQIQLASSVQDEIRELRDTVETINGVLLDAEKQLHKNEATKVWLRRLKDVVYDADDFLDEFCTQLQLKDMENKVRIFHSQSNHIAYSLKMVHKIKAIRERLERVKSDGQLLHFNPNNVNGVNYHHRETHSFVLEENVIGRDDDKKSIFQLLLDSDDQIDDNISVASIVGIGGIGKTTLVQSVYNVEKIKTHFDLRMWVCVSDDFTLRSVMEKILKSLDIGKEIEKLKMDGLQKELRKHISGKKYLLVLDDVWNKNPNQWSELKDLLTNGARGSKILVTTREEGVANIMSRPPLIYVLRGLTEDKSWSLFIKTAFEQGKEPKDSRLVAIGKNILAKCVGVPLAIRTIGRLLYGNNKEEDWLSFRDNELSEIVQEEGDILPILKLSYDHLSSPLKQCFAYCALLPKDYEFEKENLIRLWMAQGFLSTSKKNRCFEDVGNEYFLDLVSGSFLQDLREVKHKERTTMTCKMHDLMHDLAQSIVGSEIKMITSNADSINERSRHISFSLNSQSLKISPVILKADHLRTFSALCSYGWLSESHFKKIISNFRYLHTLNLSNLSTEKVPSSIGKLKLLRYLNLSSNENLRKLPNSMSKLIKLQTLDLKDCSQLKQLPRDMRKMASLQYLMIDDCYSLTGMPRGLGQLTGLRRLPLFVVGKRNRKYDALMELNRLDKLRGSLTIKVLGARENVNLADPYMSFFSKVTKIEISKSRRCQSITSLDQLPSLLLLTLQYLYNLEYISESGRPSSGSTSTPPSSTTAFFPSLKKLRIVDCENLKGWWKRNDDEDDQATTTEMAQLISFPSLSDLYIFNCPMLTCMPLYPTLEKLDLFRTSPKPLQQTLKMKMKTSVDADAITPSTSYSNSFSHPLSNLKSIDLGYVLSDFESVPELLQKCTSLEEMDIQVGFIYQKIDIGFISQTNQRLYFRPSQDGLSIHGVDRWDLFSDDDSTLSQWHGLRSTDRLQLSSIESLVRLPKWIHLITNLKQLSIWNCRNLLSLPEGMQLETLEISNCPHLKERYGNNKSVDWQKIAHIPNITIDWVWIQEGGCYEVQVEDTGDEPTRTGFYCC